MPSPFGEDSGLCKMLRLVAPRFEHRLFLSATPHNGHTRSFTGLLEMLDPVRFTCTSEMTPAIRRRVDDVVVRRLKRDINAKSASPRFCTRHPPKALTLDIGAREARLSTTFDAFRNAVRTLASKGTKRRRRAGTFAVEILGKRLLSCPTAFAESWNRARQGFYGPDAAAETELAAVERRVRQETGDDREAEQRHATAATVVGAWLRNYVDSVKEEIRGIETALDGLGFDFNGTPITDRNPVADARFRALVDLIEELLRTQGRFRTSERLVVFTEYKTTLDYLARRLRERYAEDRVLTLFGGGGPDGMDETSRENVKAAFNDPGSQVRVLVATDAASEGLNLHRTARYLLHFDCPWNPSRLEQRNGRLDRYGQARDVTVHHFVSDTDPDLRFLDHVIRKADEIREDLGSVNEIFDRAAHHRLVQGEETVHVQSELDRGIAAARGRVVIDADATVAANGEAAHQAALLEAMAGEIDLDDLALYDTLETAMAIPAGRPQLQVAEEPGFYRVRNPDLTGWRDVIDESVRGPAPGGGYGAMPHLAFSPEPFVDRLGSLSVFLPRPDALLMHLAHPMMQRALSVLTRRRYPGSGSDVSRWTVRLGSVPDGAEAVVLLSVEELGVNQLRETFHRWVRTVALPVRDGEFDEPLPHASARTLRGACGSEDAIDRILAGDVLEEMRAELRRWLRNYTNELTECFRRRLRADGEAARKREDDRYRQRQGEVSALIQQSTMDRLRRDIERLKTRKRQGRLFDGTERLSEIEQSIEEREKELQRRRIHYEEIREQLGRERSRILNHLLPARFTLAGGAQVFPVAVEIRLPERSIRGSRWSAPAGFTMVM